ncbi:hypothetical protein CRUP_017059 [Coryphaenoides rupestris]|nr:hypothetical protein CRUP_017059 [Coryphaenoides rupestris]
MEYLGGTRLKREERSDEEEGACGWSEDMAREFGRGKVSPQNGWRRDGYGTDGVGGQMRGGQVSTAGHQRGDGGLWRQRPVPSILENTECPLALSSNKRGGLAEEHRDPPKAVLVWLHPHDIWVDFSDCAKHFNISSCQLTYNRELFHMESLTHTDKTPGLENLFNLTLNYRRDADISVRYDLAIQTTHDSDFVVPKKDKLLCWIVSNMGSKGAPDRIKYYNQLKKNIHFYLAFENSHHKDYFTEKVSAPFVSGTVPVVRGTRRENYEEFVPADSFIHPKSLVEYIVELDEDDERYMRYFLWRRHYKAARHLISSRRPSVDQQDLSLGQTLLMSSRAEEDAHAFLDMELKKLWRLLFLHYPQCSESQWEEEEEVDGKKKEQRRRAIEGVIDITKLCLMEMNQEDLADTLRIVHKLISDVSTLPWNNSQLEQVLFRGQRGNRLLQWVIRSKAPWGNRLLQWVVRSKAPWGNRLLQWVVWSKALWGNRLL